MNVVAVNPTAASFLTVFPSDQPFPLSSNLNWVADQAPTPNAVTVSVSADGKVSFYNNAGTVDIAVDIVGYYEPSNSGPAGPPGPAGPAGPPGAAGPSGVTPARVVWVATAGGDFGSVNEALASIKDNSVTNPYLIKIAPGRYIESASVVLKDHVDIEGSGEGTTTITCACGTDVEARNDATNATVRADGDSLHSEVRHLTVANTATAGYSVGIRTKSSTTDVSLVHVTATAAGGTTANIALANISSGASMTNVTTSVVGTGFGLAVGVYNYLSSPIMNTVAATATGTGNTFAVYNHTSAPTINNLTATATGASGGPTAVYNYLGSPTFNNLIATASSGAPGAVGVQVHSSAVTIRDSSISGEGSVIVFGGTGLVFDSKLDGVTAGVTCFNAIDAALQPLTCS